MGHDSIDNFKVVPLNSIGVDSFVSIELKEWCNTLEEKYKNILKNVNFLDSSCTIFYIKNILSDELPCSRGLTACFIDLNTYDVQEDNIK